MDAEEIIEHLHQMGINLFVAGDTLQAGPAKHMTDEARRLIAEHKRQLLDRLRVPPDPADMKEFYEERAGIMEFDGGLSRREAEAEAARLTVAHFKLHQGEGCGTVIAPGATFADVLAALRARYGARLAEVKPVEEIRP